MSTILKPQPKPSDAPQERDPFRIGWRYVDKTQPDGSVVTEQVPLTRRDLLFPQEGDFVATHREHVNAMTYLKEVFEWRLANHPRTLVFADHRIDWQIEGLQPLGPDIAVFSDTDDWPSLKGTYRVKDMGARTVLVVEITSPSTRDKDLVDKVKLYWRAHVPYYVIADFSENDDGPALEVNAYRCDGEQGPTMVVPKEENMIWLPEVDLWLTTVGKHFVCLLPDKSTVGGYTIMAEKAHEEYSRAEAEKQRAEAEKQRADALAAELAALKAKLAQPTTNGH